LAFEAADELKPDFADTLDGHSERLTNSCRIALRLLIKIE
jgi:hypothetical protein